jgi:hypothetical protein
MPSLAVRFSHCVGRAHQHRNPHRRHRQVSLLLPQYQEIIMAFTVIIVILG